MQKTYSCDRLESFGEGGKGVCDCKGACAYSFMQMSVRMKGVDMGGTVCVARRAGSCVAGPERIGGPGALGEADGRCAVAIKRLGRCALQGMAGSMRAAIVGPRAHSESA